VWRRREGEEVTESAKERPLKNLSLEEPDAYIDEIDAMSLEELENRLPEAQEALEVIETKLEELMGLRDAALVCAAAMAARLAALKQAGDRPG
jgi:glutamyl-tRNA reductase